MQALWHPPCIKLKFMVNGRLITIKAEEIFSIIKNVFVLNIKVKERKYRNVHTFLVINAK